MLNLNIISLTEKPSSGPIQQPRSSRERLIPVCPHLKNGQQNLQTDEIKMCQMLSPNQISSTNINKDAYLQYRALKHRLERAGRKIRELELLVIRDKKSTAMDGVEEFEELKKQTKTSMQKLELMRSSSASNSSASPNKDQH